MKTRLFLVLIAVIFSAGCVASTGAVLKSNPVASDFLEKYPNSEIKITFFSASQARNIIESIRADCGNPYLESKDYYKISIEDKQSSLSLLVWLDWNNNTVECAVKKAVETPPSEQPSTPEYPPTLETPIETPTPAPTPIPTQIGACTSCDDSNKCSFDYCNEYTSYECKHKAVEPCYNNNICEEDRTSISIETELPSGPSCPNLGWSASYRGTLLVYESQAEKGYSNYVKKVNSGQNNDCPLTCDDGNTNTSDYFDFDAQKCKHYNCNAPTVPLTIKILNIEDGTTLSTRSTTLKLETNKDAKCSYSLDNYPYSSSPTYPLKLMDITGSLTHSTGLSNHLDYNRLFVHCTDNFERDKSLKIVFYVKEPSQYPKWEQDNVSITPTSLGSGGGTIEAVIATQDMGSPTINSVTFALTKPNGPIETKAATDTCATAIHTGYTSRCWKAIFNIPANNVGSIQTYTVKVSNSNIEGTKSASFTVDVYSGPPVITLGYYTSKYINNSIVYYNSTSVSIDTNINSTCSYSTKVSNATSSQDFSTKQMITADKKYHSDSVSNLQPNGTYNIYITCTHLQYSSAAFVTFKTNSTLEEQPVVYTQ